MNLGEIRRVSATSLCFGSSSGFYRSGHGASDMLESSTFREDCTLQMCTCHNTLCTCTCQKFKLDGLQQKQILNWHSRVENQIFSLQNHIFRQFFLFLTLNSHNSLTIRAFDLLPKLRASPKYQMSTGTQFEYVSLLDLVRLRFLS